MASGSVVKARERGRKERNKGSKGKMECGKKRKRIAGALGIQQEQGRWGGADSSWSD